MIRFTVLGATVPKGSTVSRVATRGDGSIVYKNGRPVTISHDSSGRKGDTYTETIAREAQVAMSAAGMRLARGVPVAVTIIEYRVRPQSHFGTGRNAEVLKASAPAKPITAPDTDKVARRVLDALIGVAFLDDAQVGPLYTDKLFGESAYIEVTVAPAAAVTVASTPRPAQLALVA